MNILEFFDFMMLNRLDKGQLPPVSWVKFYGIENEHPGYADLVDGNVHLANTVNRIKASSAWANSLIIVTHDEFGGRFDHVPPPVVDEFGPGTIDRLREPPFFTH